MKWQLTSLFRTTVKHARIDLTSGIGGDDGATPELDLLTLDDLRRFRALHRALAVLGRYQTVELYVDDERCLLSLKPQLAARWLSRGSCHIVDRAGRRRAIGWRELIAGIVDAGRAAWSWRNARAQVLGDLLALRKPGPSRNAGSGPPLYLRCEIWYGLRAGGSLGHIGGVLSGLVDAGLSPVFVSVERVPTVPPTVRSIELNAGRSRWIRSEHTQLTFNAAIVDQVSKAWAGAPPRFIYQRHALHAYAGLALARRFGVPLVLEYNGPEVWVAENWGRGVHEVTLARQCENLVLECADLVVTVSEVLRDALRARGLAGSRVITIPNAVDLDVFRPGRPVTALRRRLGLDGVTVIGFIGTFGPWHGVEVLVEAYAAARRAAPDLTAATKLLLVGDGACMARVRAAVARHGLNHAVVLTGVVPQAAGADHVGLFDIAVAPTVPNPDGTPFFGSPTKLFEYMSAGCAIVASHLGQVGEVLRDGETGLLVRAGNVDALSQALCRLLGDPVTRSLLGAAARLEAERLHGYRARTAKLLHALGLSKLDDLVVNRDGASCGLGPQSLTPAQYSVETHAHLPKI